MAARVASGAARFWFLGSSLEQVQFANGRRAVVGDANKKTVQCHTRSGKHSLLPFALVSVYFCAYYSPPVFFSQKHIYKKKRFFIWKNNNFQLFSVRDSQRTFSDQFFGCFFNDFLLQKILLTSGQGENNQQNHSSHTSPTQRAMSPNGFIL